MSNDEIVVPASQQKERRASVPVPESHRDLAEQPTFLHLVTIMPDGSPQVTPVWFEYDGTYVIVNSALGRVKDRNMRNNPAVAGSILDPNNPYRYLSFQGIVVEITTEGADEHINKLSRRYTGQDYRASTDDRVIYKIHLENTAVMG